jgi:hypothetical protein
MKKIGLLLFNIVIASFLMMAMGAPAVFGVGLGVISGFIPGMPHGSFGMAIQKEIWENDIVPSLFADNSFLQFAYNADQYVLAGKVVHIPQAGAAVGTTKNRTILPGVIVQRTDVDVTYPLNEFTTDPVLISNAETVELSYDKRTSVTSEMRSNMNQAVALDMLQNWAPINSISILRTSGAAVPAHLDGATGNRMALTMDDFRAANKLFNKQNIPTSSRYALLDADMYDQLLSSMTPTQYRDFMALVDPSTGAIGKFMNFTIFNRDKVLKYDNAVGTACAPLDWLSAGAATDNAAAIFWHINSVERALGTINFFERIADPTYYGDIYSYLVRAGGRIRRNDSKGVAVIVQSPSA